MWSPTLELRSFATLSETDRVAVILCLLESLTLANRCYLRANPPRPGLYASGVRYAKEPQGADNWQDIAQIVGHRTGDCEDLVCWRLAELREQGESALPIVRVFHEQDGGVDFHIQIERASGEIEDPSRLLGMP